MKRIINVLQDPGKSSYGPVLISANRVIDLPIRHLSIEQPDISFFLKTTQYNLDKQEK
ncbi:hypothetical protein [Photorhabdus stackebrandtii]|uniref:hypothetical protein n=1 Tax=Photorhabdus stackebrandtii TaxID=1123042 RepID=UPI00140C0AEA|nr:hypothetical protein [Photorhabdus stackebrandtii]